jgi:RHS repeat-associated protein
MQMAGHLRRPAEWNMKPEMYGELVSQRRSGATSFHHFDALGSTDKLTDSNAATLAEYLYKAFGEQTVVSGSSPNPFTWVGRLGYYRQPDAADYWVRARIMKPGIGRWLTKDPELLRLVDSVQVLGSEYYLYVLNRPAFANDPSGLSVLVIVGIGLFAVAIILGGVLLYVRLKNSDWGILRKMRKPSAAQTSAVVEKCQARNFVGRGGENAQDACGDCCFAIHDNLGKALVAYTRGGIGVWDCYWECHAACTEALAHGGNAGMAGVAGLNAWLGCAIKECVLQAQSDYLNHLRFLLSRFQRKPPPF